MLAKTFFLMLFVGVVCSAAAQTMPKKWDDKCLEEARKAYINCMAGARSESAKDTCEKDKVSAEKRCKIAMGHEPPSTLALLENSKPRP